jgi:hypothetical protein
MQRAHADFYTSAIDAITAIFGGCVLRTYTGAFSSTLAVQTFGSVPAGTVLSEFTIPTPSHQPAAFNAAAATYEALITNSWQDLQANASGSFGCFAIFRAGQVVYDGTAGGPGSGKDMILSAASVTVNAPFSITKFSIRKPPMS